MRCCWVLAVALLATSCLAWAQEIPAGTVIPVMMTMTIDSDKVYAGEQITAKVMDTVPLASEGQIPAGSKVFGHVAQVKPGDKEGPAWVAIQFDHVTVRGREVPLKANVRALASMMAVYDAQVPFFEPDTTPRSAVMLAPVGGDPAFRPDNPEKASRRLVHFSGELPAGCGGRVDQQGATGALWVFSPYACGVYGFGKGLVIVRDGSTDGTIVLGAKKDVQVHAGSGLLLRAGSDPGSSDSEATAR
ncbi:MAG: hypothetical protein WA655_08345 [Candidatus Korobacteraceae bacterium]